MVIIVLICHVLHRLSFWDSSLVVAIESGVISILSGFKRIIHQYVPSISSCATSSSGFWGKSILIRAMSSLATEHTTFVNYEGIIEYFSFLITIVDLNVDFFIDTIFDLGHFLSREKPTVLLSVLKLGFGIFLDKVSRQSRIPPHYISDGWISDTPGKCMIRCLDCISGYQMTRLGLWILSYHEHIDNTICRACWWMWSNRLIALM